LSERVRHCSFYLHPVQLVVDFFIKGCRCFPVTMQFTPQQLSGGPKYTSAVKIGNWAEDRAKAEVRGTICATTFV